MFILRMCTVKIMFDQLRVGLISYPAASITHSVDRFIVDDNKFSVFCELHIQFNSICAQLYRFLKSCHCIFRCITACTAVSSHECSFHLFSIPAGFFHLRTKSACPASILLFFSSLPYILSGYCKMGVGGYVKNG